MSKYLIYCRKSSEDEDRQVISNESQAEELTPIATRDRLHVCDTIKEEASAKLSRTRPRFNEMLKRIERGEADAILCWHLNRLSRNAGDAAALIELMDQNRLVEIRTPGQTFKNSPGDKFLITLFCSQAKLENDNKGVDVKRGLRTKVTMGFYPGVAPMGYLNDKTKLRGERDLYNDPDRFPLVKRMWNMMLTGNHTPPQIVKIANEKWGFRTRRTRKQGGNPLSLSALYHIFHNPFYYGWFEYPIGSGKWYQGKHEPMITKEEFDRVQTFVGRKGNPRPSQPMPFSFTGLIRCGACGGMITAEAKFQIRCTNCRTKFSCRQRNQCPRCQTAITEMSKPEVRRYVYYHCAKRKAGCRQESVSEAELEKQVLKRIDRIHITAQLKEWAFEFLDELYRDELNAKRHSDQSNDKAYASCLKRLENLINLKTSAENADGSLLSDEEYSKQRQKLLEEKARLKSPQDPKLQAKETLRLSKAVFEFAHSARRRFLDGDFQVKREVLSNLGSNQTLMDKKLIFEARKPLSYIEDFNSPASEEIDGIEPEKEPQEYGRNGQTDDEFSRQLRDLKEARTGKHGKRRKLGTLIHRFYLKGMDTYWKYIWN